MRTNAAVILTMVVGCLLRGQVVESKKGPVEFIGLETWTPEQIQAGLERLPDGDLHYCAADIKKAGIAEASVVIHIGNDDKWYTVVTVVEPQRAAEIAWRASPASSIAVPSTWAVLEEAARSGHLLDKPPTPLRERTAAADYDQAIEVLRGSAEATDREAAAAILTNFADRDGAWQALAGGLRDPDNRVASVCQQALNQLRRHAARRVEWAPAAADLAAVLHGTNLFAFQELLETLAATEVQPSLAEALLGHGGGRLLLACLRAQHPNERRAAHALLVQLRSADLGEAPEPWAAWIAAL